MRGPSSSPRARRRSPRCPRSGTRCPPGSSTAHPRARPGPCPATATRTICPTAGCSWSGRPPAGSRSPRRCTRSGRPVTLAVGEHVRMPRTYRGRDVLWWMDATGLLDDRYDQVPDLARARVLPSMQLIGSPERATLDLNTLARAGVRLVGRLARRAGRDGAVVRLAAQRLHARRPQAGAAAGHVRRVGGDGRVEQTAGPPAMSRSRRRSFPTHRATGLDLRSGEIRTIIWATGLRPDFDPGRPAGVRPQGQDPPRRRRVTRALAST